MDTKLIFCICLSLYLILCFNEMLNIFDEMDEVGIDKPFGVKDWLYILCSPIVKLFRK